jgi:hypothetical protein
MDETILDNLPKKGRVINLWYKQNHTHLKRQHPTLLCYIYLPLKLQFWKLSSLNIHLIAFLKFSRCTMSLYYLKKRYVFEQKWLIKHEIKYNEKGTSQINISL